MTERPSEAAADGPNPADVPGPNLAAESRQSQASDQGQPPGRAKSAAGGRKPDMRQLTLRLSAREVNLVMKEARRMGLTRNAWIQALIRARLHAKPTFGRPFDLQLMSAQNDAHIAVLALKQIARRMEAEGRLTLADQGKVLWHARNVHMALRDLRSAVDAGLQYWRAEG